MNLAGFFSCADQHSRAPGALIFSYHEKDLHALADAALTAPELAELKRVLTKLEAAAVSPVVLQDKMAELATKDPK